MSKCISTAIFCLGFYNYKFIFQSSLVLMLSHDLFDIGLNTVQYYCQPRRECDDSRCRTL